MPSTTLAFVPDSSSDALKSSESLRLKGELAFRTIRGEVSIAMQILDEYPDQINVGLDVDGSSTLHLAVRGGHLALTRELLGKGAEVNRWDAQQRTPLHVACEEQHADLVLELIIAKADPDIRDATLQTSLHKAVRGNNVEVVKVLMEHGRANATIGDGTMTTPLMLAAELGKADLAACLLEEEPQLVGAANASGWTALHLAAHGREMRKRSPKELELGKFACVVKSILQARAEVDARDEDGKTPLHRAANSGNIETATELLSTGADVNAPCMCRWTPLHYVCQEGHYTCAKLFLDARAEVQRANASCLVPLAVATMENHVKVAQLLMSHRADPNFRCGGIASPIMIARKDKERYNEMLALFELGWINHASA
mmetsp:Transcript_91796/g.259188  ORF Transcript_91796/g.259188 Transcript_91796/m.259188 type:complete len:372 (-) Transcript_91796:70-1185(-)